MQRPQDEALQSGGAVKVMLPISHCSIERDLAGPLSSTMHEACEVLHPHYAASFFYIGKPTLPMLILLVPHCMMLCKAQIGSSRTRRSLAVFETGGMCDRNAYDDKVVATDAMPCFSCRIISSPVLLVLFRYLRSLAGHRSMSAEAR